MLTQPKTAVSCTRTSMSTKKKGTSSTPEVRNSITPFAAITASRHLHSRETLLRHRRLSRKSARLFA